MNDLKRRENWQEKVSHLKRLTGWEQDECETFIKLVDRYLDTCGYFYHDFNIHGFPTKPDEIKYAERDFGTWLMDMALQYNMEQGVEYECNFVRDRREHELVDGHMYIDIGQ